MLAIETTHPTPLFRKSSIFRRFSKRTKPLKISNPILAEPNSEPTPHSPRKLTRRSPDHQPRVREPTPPLPPLTNKPKTFITHIRVDSATFPDLPISQQFSATQPSPTHSRQSSSSSTQSHQTTEPTSRIPRSAHPTHPFPGTTQISAWDLFLPPSQVHKLYTGTAPVGVGDLWFIFSEGPDVNGKLKVHFHRAWTGVKVAELFVVMDLKGGGAGKVVGVKWAGEGGRGVVRGACRVGLGVELEGEEF